MSLLGGIPWRGSREVRAFVTGQQCVAQDATGKECGLHSGNVVASAAEQAQQEAVRDLWDSDSSVQQLSHDQLASLLDGRRDKSTVLVMYAPWCQYSQVCQLSSSPCFPYLHSSYIHASSHMSHRPILLRQLSNYDGVFCSSPFL